MPIRNNYPIQNSLPGIKLNYYMKFSTKIVYIAINQKIY